MNIINHVGNLENITDSKTVEDYGYHYNDSSNIAKITDITAGYTGEIARVEYTNLVGYKYGDTPISKLVAIYSTDLTNQNAKLSIFNNPTDGFDRSNLSVITELEFYDNDGNKIKFNPENSFLAFGSLNNWVSSKNSADRIESVELLSTGTMFGLQGSSVSVDGKKAYSKQNNSFILDEDGKEQSYANPRAYTKEVAEKYSPTGKPWDVPYDEYGAFYGAVIASINGDNIKFKSFDNNQKSKDYGAGSAWFNYSSLIPATSDIKLDAKLTNVALQQ